MSEWMESEMTDANEMVERVAEALFFVGLSHNPLYGEAVQPEVLPGLREASRPHRLSMARAAIEALREPTEAMLDAYSDGVARDDPRGKIGPDGYDCHIGGWHAMIDAALASPSIPKGESE